MAEDRNVFGEPLAACSTSLMIGFLRTGCRETDPQDVGAHLVCAQMTEASLAFSRSMCNDLTTLVPAFGFPGLKAADRWSLCVGRWKEALDVGMAPPVVLTATHERVLDYVALADLKKFAIDLS